MAQQPEITIWYNPDCSKCRETKDLAENAGCTITIKEYLQGQVDREELVKALKLLGINAIDLVRKTEPLYLSDYQHQNLDNDAWIDILMAHPELMERPVIIYNGKAVIGRPPSRIIDLLQE